MYFVFLVYFFIIMAPLTHAESPTIVVVIDTSDASQPSDQYAIQALLSAWCSNNDCSDEVFSLPVTAPQTFPLSKNGQVVDLIVMDNSQVSYSDISDTKVIAIVALTSKFFNKLSPNVPLPALTIAASTVPINFIQSANLLSLLPDAIQLSSALYYLLSHDDIRRFSMIYEPNQQNIVLFSNLMIETDNFQRLGYGVNLDGSPNTSRIPVQLATGFPIFDSITALFELQKGLKSNSVGNALKYAHANAIVFYGAVQNLSNVYSSLSNNTIPCYGIGNLMNDDTLNLPVNIPVQLVVPAIASDRSQLEQAFSKTFNIPPPFHFLTDYGYDAGLYLKALVEQHAISQTTFDSNHILERANSFVTEGITGSIGMGVKKVEFTTVVRECQPSQNCQWSVSAKTISLNSGKSAKPLRKLPELSEPKVVLKKQKRAVPKIVCFFPETMVEQDNIDMVQKIKRGFQLATENAPFSVEYVDSYGDANRVRLLFYGNSQYIITQEKLTDMGQDGVPTDILTQLSSLVDQTFETEFDLLDQLVLIIGTEATQNHGGIITFHAYSGNGYYDLSDILSVVTLKSSATEAITILPEKRNILVLGPASDTVCDVRSNIVNFFPQDQKIVEALEKRLSYLTRINSNMHRYVTIVQSDPSESPLTQGIFHKLFSNNNFFENIIQQYNGCDPRISGECHAANYPQWIGTLPFYGFDTDSSMATILASIQENVDHLIYMGDAKSFSILLNDLSSYPTLLKKLWTAIPELDRISIPQLASIDDIRLQVITSNERKQNDETDNYVEQFVDAFGYIPGRFEDVGYDMGLFLSKVAQNILHAEKNLSRSEFLMAAQQMNYLRFIETDPRLMIPKKKQWLLPSKFDYNQDGQTNINDAVLLLKKCIGN